MKASLEPDMNNEVLRYIKYIHAATLHAVLCLVTQSWPTLATPRTVAHQKPLFMGILQAKILEWVAMLSSRGSFPTQGSNPGLPHFTRFFTI